MSTDEEFPTFLNDDFFAKVLKSGLHLQNVQIIDVDIVLGSPKGENYCSEIYRASVLYNESCEANDENGNIGNNEKISLIVKAMPYSEMMTPLFETMNVYEKEVIMYTEIIPKLSALLGDEYLSAKCFYTSTDPINIIVFEDLKELGYIMADREVGLDSEHCAVVLGKIARFHAASAALAEREPSSMDKFNFGIINPYKPLLDTYDSFYVGGLSSLIEVVESWPGAEEIVRKLKDNKNDFINKILRSIYQTASKFKVLNHGDLWVNNCLFKYNAEHEPVDVVFVDYQLSFYSSPGIDLHHFMVSSPIRSVRENNENWFLDIYYENFSKTLLKLNAVQHLTLTDVTDEINSRQFYGFMLSFSLLPLFIMDKKSSQSSDMDAVAGKNASKELRNAMYFGSKYQETLKYLINQFDRFNVFENIC